MKQDMKIMESTDVSAYVVVINALCRELNELTRNAFNLDADRIKRVVKEIEINVNRIEERLGK